MTTPEKLVRELIDRWNEGDRESLLVRVDPDTELHSRLGTMRGGHPYVGVEGFQQWLSDIDDHFSGFHLNVGEIRELKPGRMFATGTIDFRGRGSDLPWQQETAWILDIEGERLRRMEIFTDKEEGLRAAGE